jgi:glycosyltransferase involved in cell wall biosynthesis
MKTAVLFYRVGPYHFARLRAAGERMRVTVVEYSNVDPFYAWDEVSGQDGFERVTLFNGVPVEQQSAKMIAARVRAVLSELRPEVVAIPGWHDRCALAALKWCCDEGVPTVVMSDTTPWDYKRNKWKEAVKRRIVGCFAAALVAGRPHKDYMVQLGMPAERVFPGYDVVDNDYFAAGAARARSQEPGARSQHGLPENYFLASARFVEKKNLSRLIEAYARYRTLCEDHGRRTTDDGLSAVSGPVVPWSLVLLGDGPLRETLNSQLSTLNLHGQVQMPGFKQYPDLPVFYGLAGAFIHASTTEQWGLVVNEAMASGLPVLVSNRCGCAADLVQEGRNGFTFDPCNVEQLAQLMLKASASGFPISEFGLAGREIIGEWSPDRFGRSLQQAAAFALKAGPGVPSLIARLFLNGVPMGIKEIQLFQRLFDRDKTR